ncbi:MAG: NAD-dependent epimerase/dehydratase family protein [Bacteroidota bacterium]
MNASLPKILILGGTEFVGRQLVEHLLESKDYDVYLFNRGKTNPNLFPHANRIIGDRETDDIEQIGQYHWDHVVDFSSYFPDSLQRTLDHINRDVKTYIYISTISVYTMAAYGEQTMVAEDFPKKTFEPEQLREPSLKFYGEKKAACEDILNRADWLESIVLRPSVIYGKYDPTDRIYYWIDRIKNKGKLILPQNGAYHISLTFASDLVETIKIALNGKLAPGTYNCVSDQPYHFHELMEAIRAALKSKCQLIPADKNWLREKNLTNRHFPLWWGAGITIDNQKLRMAADPKFTSVQDSISQTTEYYRRKGWPSPKVGITYEEEEKLLDELNTIL